MKICERLKNTDLGKKIQFEKKILKPKKIAMLKLKKFTLLGKILFEKNIWKNIR